MPANQHTVRIPVYRQNTDIPLKYRYGHRHIYTNSLLFSQCAVYTGYCEIERFFQFSTRIRFLVLLLYTCHLTEIIAILNWIHEGVN